MIVLQGDIFRKQTKIHNVEVHCNYQKLHVDMVGALAPKQLELRDALAVIYQPTNRARDNMPGDRLKDAIRQFAVPVKLKKCMVL